MASASKHDSDAEGGTDLQTIISDVAALKRDLAKLVHNIGGGASDQVQGAVEHLGDEAARLYGNLAAQGRRSVKAVGHQVEEQPVIALLLAFAVGFIGCRLLRR